jgi:hypothetical protein
MDTLVAVRLSSPPDPLRTLKKNSALATLWGLIVTTAAQHWADSITAHALMLEHHAANPILQSTHARQAAALYVIRAFKFLHLITPLVFSRCYQAHGASWPQSGLAARMRLVASGDFAALLQAVLQAAQPPWGDTHALAEDSPDPLAPRAAPTRAGDKWTDADAALQHGAAWYTTRRHGIRFAARMLAQEEVHAPCDEETLQKLLDKHPAPGADAMVAAVSHAEARAIMLQVRARCNMLTSASRASLQFEEPAAPSLPPRFQQPAPALVSLPQHKQFITITAQDIATSVMNAPAGRSAGNDALRYESLQAAMNEAVYAPGPEDVAGVVHRNLSLLQHLARGYTVLLHTPEAVPEEAQRLWRAAPCTALGEKRRPVAAGTVWRRLLSATVARLLREGRLGELLQKYHQYGFGAPAGVELVATTVRFWHEMAGAVAQVDVQNAFNSFCRGACARALECLCPALLPLFQFVYGGRRPPELTTTLRVSDGAAEDRIHVFYSQLGVQQGDPLGPVYFTLTTVYLLWLTPAVPRDFLSPPSPAALAPFAVALPPPPPPHTALHDDLNLRLPPGFPAASAAALEDVAERFARGGLRLRPDKSCVLAQQGESLDASEVARLDEQAVPYVDASQPRERRGVRVVGVPVGTAPFMAAFLHNTLFADSLWRLAWQLIGMARKDLQAAFKIFRMSLSRRFNFLARNVEPAVARPWLAAFDTFCLWVLEQLLALKGSVTAAAAKQHLLQACEAADATAAAAGAFLHLHILGAEQLTLPPPFAALALEVARLPGADGGLGLPQLHVTCDAAYAGRLAAIGPAALVELLPDLPLHLRTTPSPTSELDQRPPPAPPHHLPPAFEAMRAVLRYWLRCYRAEAADAQQPPGAQPPPDPPPAPPPFPAELAALFSPASLAWAQGSSTHLPEAIAALAAAAPATPPNHPELGVAAPAAQPSPPDPPSSTPTPTPFAPAPPFPFPEAPPPQVADDDQDPLAPNAPPRVRAQRVLTRLLARRRARRLFSVLEQLGERGRMVAAQLRSQSSSTALAWLDRTPGGADPLPTPAVVTMLLLAVSVDAWHVQGPQCPYGACPGPTTVAHAVMCAKQHEYGRIGQHTSLKYALQRLLHSAGITHVFNEEAFPFGVGTHRRMDTVIPQQSLLLASDAGLAAGKGVLLDTSVAAPTATNVFRRSAQQAGHAAAVREREKEVHYNGFYDARTWWLVPFVHEAFGRLGKQARRFLGQLATHAATASGGSLACIRRRRGELLRRFLTEMSYALARASSERVMAYVRGARLAGRTCHPVSSALELTGETPF